MITYDSPYHKACVELALALTYYLKGIATLGPVHHDLDDFGACLSEIFAPDIQFPDREMTKEEDRIFCAYLERVSTKLNGLTELAKELNERKLDLRR